MTLRDIIKKIQQAYNAQGEKLTVDGNYGPISEKVAEKYDLEIVAKRREENPTPMPIQPAAAQPWKKEAEADLGKKETDPVYEKKVVGFWPKVGLNFKTIAKSWAAWCGVGVAMWLTIAGFPVQPDGAGAKNWAKYGHKIEWKVNGIPESAIVSINHNAKCGSGSGNHVTLANKSIAAKDIITMTKNDKGVWEYKVKEGATFPGLGGNQGNKVSIQNYPVAHICSVNWPKENLKGEKVAIPPPVLVSTGQGGAASKESTR